MEAAEGDTDSTGGVAWKHTDRVLSARLSRQEQLEKEKGVVEDALRSRCVEGLTSLAVRTADHVQSIRTVYPPL